MACGNALRAIRTLRDYPLGGLEDRRSDAKQKDFCADGPGLVVEGRQGGLGTTERMGGKDEGKEATPDPQHHVGAKRTAELEGLTSATAPTTASKDVSSTAQGMTDEKLLLAFPWLANESNCEDCSDEEGADDDNESFTPVHRSQCEDLIKIL
eukprot:TRINITY_DN73793_c0_g1_i1.p1 TRINITY_DN73793_c0_g1~~TRINITY_DN73793_c0_g1_i1.p1  ORF type:complete len:174 (+),score=24.17 TRINITY_DN73793_c0_g1_i1:66-524(+)